MTAKISKYIAQRIILLHAFHMPIDKIAKEVGVSYSTAEIYACYKEKGFSSPQEFREHKIAIAKRKPRLSIEDIVTQDELEKMFHGDIEIPFCSECGNLIKPYNNTSYFYCKNCGYTYLMKKTIKN